MSDLHSSGAKNTAIGFALSGVFLAMLVWFDVAGFASFLFETTFGWLVALAIWVLSGMVFGRVQMFLETVSFEDDDDDEDHHGGRRSRDMEADHAVVRVPVEKNRGPF